MNYQSERRLKVLGNKNIKETNTEKKKKNSNTPPDIIQNKPVTGNENIKKRNNTEPLRDAAPF